MKNHRIEQCLNDIQEYEKWETCLLDKVGFIYSIPMPL